MHLLYDLHVLILWISRLHVTLEYNKSGGMDLKTWPMVASIMSRRYNQQATAVPKQALQLSTLLTDKQRHCGIRLGQT